MRVRQTRTHDIRDKSNPTTTNNIVDGGVTTQYDQKIVRLISRSNASPDAACVIYAVTCELGRTRSIARMERT